MILRGCCLLDIIFLMILNNLLKLVLHSLLIVLVELLLLIWLLELLFIEKGDPNTNGCDYESHDRGDLPSLCSIIDVKHLEILIVNSH